MRTIWTGRELILEFADRNVNLNIEETKEFEDWLLRRAKEFSEKVI
jgi:hypothetical protein